MSTQQLESFVLTHTYEKYSKGKFMPSVVRPMSTMNSEEVELLVFYIQVMASNICEDYGMGSSEIAEILNRFYGFELLGQDSIDELKKKGQIINNTWHGRIAERHYTVIDIYYNWEKYICIHRIIETVQYFYRDGLNEYLIDRIKKVRPGYSQG